MMYYIWIGIAVLSLLIVFIGKKRRFIWYFIASALNIVVEYAGESGVASEIVVFVIFLILSLFFPLLKHLRSNADRLLKRKFVLIEDASLNNPGTIRVDDVEWQVLPKHKGKIKAGRIVKVVAISGVRLIVVPSMDLFKKKVKAPKEVKKEEKVETIIEEEVKPVVVEEPAPVKEPEPVVVEEPAPVKEPEPVVVEEPTPVKEPEPVVVEEPAPVKEPEPVVVEKPAPVKEPEPVVVEKPTPVKEPEPIVVEEPAPVRPNINEDEEEVEEIIDENGKKRFVIKRVAFATKLERSDKILKDRYNEIKGYLLSYGQHSRLAFGKETFSLHKNISAILTISGKTLKIYLPLNAKDFENSNARLIDVSDKKKYEKTPAAYRLKSDLSVKKCLSLIDIVLKDAKYKEIAAKDYASETIKEFKNRK